MSKKSKKPKQMRSFYAGLWRPPHHPDFVSVPHDVLDGSRTLICSRSQVDALLNAMDELPGYHVRELPFPTTLFEFEGPIKPNQSYSNLPHEGAASTMKGVAAREQQDEEGSLIGVMAWVVQALPTYDLTMIYDTATDLSMVSKSGGWHTPLESGDRGLAVDALRVVNAILYMLDSANVDLVEAEVQHPRGHVAHGNIRYEIFVRPSKNRYKRRDDTRPANYSHRFEVRGNFAHHYATKPDGSENQLFTKWALERPEKLIEHAGQPCIRIWRPPYVKGPSDKPLIPKLRRVA